MRGFSDCPQRVAVTPVDDDIAVDLEAEPCRARHIDGRPGAARASTRRPEYVAVAVERSARKVHGDGNAEDRTGPVSEPGWRRGTLGHSHRGYPRFKAIGATPDSRQSGLPLIQGRGPPRCGEGARIPTVWPCIRMGVLDEEDRASVDPGGHGAPRRVRQQWRAEPGLLGHTGPSALGGSGPVAPANR